MNTEEQAKALFFRALDDRKAGRHAEAEELLREAMTLDPTRPSIRINLSGALIDQGKHTEALPLCLELVEEEPDRGVCWHRLSLCQSAAGLTEAALASIDRCVELEPENLDAISCKIALLLDLNDTDAAMTWAKAGVALAPDNANMYTALGVVHRIRREFDDALACNLRAAELMPDDSDRLWNLSLVQLMLGDYTNGWFSMEARWTGTQPVNELYDGNAPRWDGESSLCGKRLLVWSEQGLGDCLQFLRYLPALAQRATSLTVQVPHALYPLLKNLYGLNVIAYGSPPPPHDLQLPLLSVPLCLGEDADIPAPTLLSVPEEYRQRWQMRLGTPSKPRIGLMWRGNQENQRGLHRSLQIAKLQSLFELPFEFHCVSNEALPDDAQWLYQHRQPIQTHVRDIHNFADTAALLKELDLLITIDTSIAHLGPSLKVPTWVLLSTEADWRWDTAETTRWYPDCRLFRQQARGDWSAPVSALRKALAEQFGCHTGDSVKD